MRRVDKPLFSLTGMVLNNGSDDPHSLSLKRKPPWLRAKMPGGEGYTKTKAMMKKHNLFTVCEEASCPNLGECWDRGITTIMILGDTCTRACGFCNVRTGRPPVLDKDEPRRVAESLRLMHTEAGIKHVVITSVNRDELPDGGAGIWAETIIRSRDASPDLSIEVLIPDFQGDWGALQMVIDAEPQIINHNIECVKRMYPAVRPSAKYARSIELLRRVKEQGKIAKTGIMVGIGERDEEVLELIDEVLAGTAVGGPSGKDETSEPASMPRCPDATMPSSASPPLPDSCDILTIGQYLQPTRNHLPIDRWVTPEQFGVFKAEGLRRGFKVVESGPLVRSSYHADQQADVLGMVAKKRG